MRQEIRVGMRVAAVLMVVMASARAAVAQPAAFVPRAVTVGATFGIAASGNTSSGGGDGPLASAHVDVPASFSWRVRVAAGTTRWTPHNDPLDAGQGAGRVWLSGVTVGALRYVLQPTRRLPVGMYAGLGVGAYRYRIQHGPFRPGARGVHALGGMEYVNSDRRLAVSAEVTIHGIGGPEHQQVWAYTVPQATIAVGIGKRF